MQKHRNTHAGRAYENELADTFNQLKLFPELSLTEDFDKALDARKYDIAPRNEKDFKDFRYQIQAKNTTRNIQYSDLIEDMLPFSEDKIPVIFHKRTKKVSEDRFITIGRYGIMSQKDMIDLMSNEHRYKLAYREFMTYWDSLHDEAQKNLHKYLTRIGL